MVIMMVVMVMMLMVVWIGPWFVFPLYLDLQSGLDTMDGVRRGFACDWNSSHVKWVNYGIGEYCACSSSHGTTPWRERRRLARG